MSSSANGSGPRSRAARRVEPPHPTADLATSVMLASLRPRLQMPGELYAAARTDDTGAVVHTAGPFLDEADAAAHVAAQFGGQGYAVPFELVFRRLRERSR